MTQLEDLSSVQRLLYELRLGAMGVAYSSSNGDQRATVTAADNQRLALVDEIMRRVGANDQSNQGRTAMRNWDQAYPSFLAARRQIIALVDQDVWTAPR